MNALEVALNAKLTGHAPLMALLPGGVHNGEAPPGTKQTYLVFSLHGGSDSYTMGGPDSTGVWRPTYNVRVYQPQADHMDAAQAMRLVDGLLTGGDLVVDGWHFMECLRVGDVPARPVRQGDFVWSVVGNLFEFWLQRA